MLPRQVAADFARDRRVEPQPIPDASLLFVKLYPFSANSSPPEADQLFDVINHCFKAFDAIVARHGLLKVRTVGSGYLAVGGSAADDHGHPLRSTQAALEISAFMGQAEKLQGSLRRYFGGTSVEDMWLPFFAVSANLSRNCVVVHDRGPLWLALRATASLPGILPPVVHHGDLLIDGGVLNNLPIDIMKERFRGHTVAVDLGVDVDFTTDRATMPSPYELLRSRMLPFSEPIAAPTIMSVIVKTATLGRTELGEEDVDLYLNPPLQGFELLDWQRIHSLVDAGYRYTRERLAAWPGATRLIQRDELFDSRGISGIARRFP